MIALDEAAVGVGSATLHHLRDEDAGAGFLSNDGETQTAVLLLVKLDIKGFCSKQSFASDCNWSNALAVYTEYLP